MVGRYSKLTHLHAHTHAIDYYCKVSSDVWPLLNLYIKRADSTLCHAQQSQTHFASFSNKLELTTLIIIHMVSVLGLPPLQPLLNFSMVN